MNPFQSLVLFALFAIALVSLALVSTGKTRMIKNQVMTFLAALAFVPVWLRFGHFASRLAANIGEGTHEGQITKKSDIVLTARYRLAKFGTDSSHVALCTQATVPIGIFTDEVATIEDNVNIELLVGPQTKKMVAHAALVAGIPVYALAAGRVGTPAGSSGAAYQVGVTLTAAAAQDDIVEVVPSFGVATF